MLDKISCNRIEALARLKRELGSRLVTPERITPAAGIATGWPLLDRFLLWHGFPKDAVSLLISDAGGATSLWMRSAAAVTQRGQWVAWMNDRDSALTPWGLRHRKVDLSRLLWVSQPQDVKQTLWALQELLSLSLFELIGCDLGGMGLKEHQVLRLKKLAQSSQAALVLITHARILRPSPFYSLILHFERNHVAVIRALHRPTPHILERRDLYADTLPLLTAGECAFPLRKSASFRG
ncbi:MAG: recA protein [Bdellovibrionales bacterium]